MSWLRQDVEFYAYKGIAAEDLEPKPVRTVLSL